MKRYNKNSPPHLIELETISAKKVFDLVENLGLGKHGEVEIWLIPDTDNECKISYRVNIEKKGYFQISSVHTTEEFELKYGDWINVIGHIHHYHSCSTTFNGDPFLRIEDAYDLLKEKLQGI